jgi:hypothetical protein
MNILDFGSRISQNIRNSPSRSTCTEKRMMMTDLKNALDSLTIPGLGSVLCGTFVSEGTQ